MKLSDVVASLDSDSEPQSKADGLPRSKEDDSPSSACGSKSQDDSTRSRSGYKTPDDMLFSFQQHGRAKKPRLGSPKRCSMVSTPKAIVSGGKKRKSSSVPQRNTATRNTLSISGGRIQSGRPSCSEIHVKPQSSRSKSADNTPSRRSYGSRLLTQSPSTSTHSPRQSSVSIPHTSISAGHASAGQSAASTKRTNLSRNSAVGPSTSHAHGQSSAQTVHLTETSDVSYEDPLATEDNTDRPISSVLGDISNMLGTVLKRLERHESKLESMERKLQSASSSGSSSESAIRKKDCPTSCEGMCCVGCILQR